MATTSRRSLRGVAFLGLETTAFRAGARTVDVDTIIQTIGTESFGTRVGVAVTGYFLGIRYTHTLPGMTMSAGFRHLSSHPARDLDDKEDEVRAEGGTDSEGSEDSRAVTTCCS